MASYAGNKNLKQDKNAKGKYQSLNINNIYRGSSVSQPKILGKFYKKDNVQTSE